MTPKYDHRCEIHPCRHSKNLPRPPPSAWWGPGAAYAPGFPIYDIQNGFESHPRRLPTYAEKRSSSDPVPVRLPPLPGIIRKAHLPRISNRHVHFDLQSRERDRKREMEGRPIISQHKRPATPAHPPYRSSHCESRIPIPRQEDPRKLFKQDPQRRLPLDKPIRPEPRPISNQLLPPNIPTIHIITYALDHAPHAHDGKRVLDKYLPSKTKHLGTIAAYTFTPPPPKLCQLYSGISPIIQEHVMQDSRARKAVKQAVNDIIACGKSKCEAARKEGRNPKDVMGDVSIGVCCTYGTHRSVSVAERIARSVEEWVAKHNLQVKVRVVHVHRVRGEKDPY